MQHLKKEPSIVSLFNRKQNECCLKCTNTCLKCIFLQILTIQCNFRQEKGTFRHSRTILKKNTSWSEKNQSWNAKNWYKMIQKARLKQENRPFRQTLIHSWLWSCKIKDWPSKQWRSNESPLFPPPKKDRYKVIHSEYFRNS